MSLGSWFQRLFSARGGGTPQSAEETAALLEEYGSDASEPLPGSVDAPEPPPEMMGTPGVPGLAGLETTEAVEAQEAEFKPPPDPAR